MAKLTDSEGNEVEAFTGDEVAALIAEQVQGLKGKNDELIGESRAAKKKAQDLEDAQTEIEKERLKEKQEFKTLFEREQEAKAELLEKHDKFRDQIQKKDIKIAISDLVKEATKDTSRAKALEKIISDSAKYDDEKGVYYELGGLAVDKTKILEHYSKEYPFLFDGVDSSGGGATGGNGGAVSKKFNDMSGAELKALRAESQSEYDRLKAERN